MRRTRAHLPIQPPANPFAKDLMNVITRLQPTLEAALASSAPNLICGYIYELAGAVNEFYHAKLPSSRKRTQP